MPVVRRRWRRWSGSWGSSLNRCWLPVPVLPEAGGPWVVPGLLLRPESSAIPRTHQPNRTRHERRGHWPVQAPAPLRPLETACGVPAERGTKPGPECLPTRHGTTTAAAASWTQHPAVMAKWRGRRTARIGVSVPARRAQPQASCPCGGRSGFLSGTAPSQSTARRPRVQEREYIEGVDQPVTVEIRR